jgi:Coenzyme PQQ synthesis protein D (PqqD)
MSGGVSVILDLNTGTYYKLDAVGTQVWNLLSERPCTLEELVRAVAGEHDVEAERCQHDVFAFVGELATAGLVEVGDGEPG